MEPANSNPASEARARPRSPADRRWVGTSEGSSPTRLPAPAVGRTVARGRREQCAGPLSVRRSGEWRVQTDRQDREEGEAGRQMDA